MEEYTKDDTEKHKKI